MSMRPPRSLSIVGCDHELAIHVARLLGRYTCIPIAEVKLVVIQLPPRPPMCGWQLIQRWFSSANVAINPPDFVPIAQEKIDCIQEVIVASNVAWQTTHHQDELIWQATYLRTRFLIDCANKEENNVTVVPVSIHDTAWRPSPFEETNTPAENLVLKRLQDLEANPGWLASDEADLFLQHLRWAVPNVLFVPPAMWCDRRNILIFFQDLCPDLRIRGSNVLVVLVQHHWILIVATHTVRKLVLEITAPSTFSEVLFPLCHLVTRRAGFAPQDMEVVFSTQPDIPNMCGWKILADLQKKYLPSQGVPIFREIEAGRFSNRIKAIQIFQASMETWQQATDDQNLIHLAKVTRAAFLESVLEKRIVHNYQAGGAVSTQSPAQPSQAAVASTTPPQDPLWERDPWAKKKRPQHTRWEDLQLDTAHPFRDSEDQQINQTHRLQLAGKKNGIVLATKTAIPELTQTVPSAACGILLPATDVSSFGNVASKISGPFEIIVADKLHDTTYKRLALLLTLKGPIQYKLENSTCKFTTTKQTELVLEIDPRLLPKADFEAAQSNPLQTFKKLFTCIHSVFPTVARFYGIRQNKHPTAAKGEFQVQCVVRVPEEHRKTALQASGQHGLLIRDFLDKGQSQEDFTVLPKFIEPSVQSLKTSSSSRKVLGETLGLSWPKGD